MEILQSIYLQVSLLYSNRTMNQIGNRAFGERKLREESHLILLVVPTGVEPVF